jgi:hypothetical protein
MILESGLEKEPSVVWPRQLLALDNERREDGRPE